MVTEVGKDNRKDWTFSQYVYEIEYLSEMSEIPLANLWREKMVAEVGQKFPVEWKGLVNGTVDI